jgi:hypothetical protein
LGTVFTRYLDRRRHLRIPVGEAARWRSLNRAGLCELRDLSPGGAGLRMSVRKAMQLGEEMTLEIDLPGGRRWTLARRARVVRRTPDDGGSCLVAVTFGPEEWNQLPTPSQATASS